LATLSDNFEELAAKALELALAGDTQMLKFLLSGAYDIKSLQILDDDGAAQSFAELAKAARNTQRSDDADE
jgi:hypothetical protein